MRPKIVIFGVVILGVLVVAVAVATHRSRSTESMAAGPISVGTVRHDAIDVSIIRLIAAPQEYSKKVVRVFGYLNVEFEGHAVYFHEEDFKRGLSANALWIDAKPEIMKDLKRLSGRYVLLEGTFDATNTGHMSLFSGAIVDISRGDDWSWTREQK